MPDSMPAGGESPPSAPRHPDHQWGPPAAGSILTHHSAGSLPECGAGQPAPPGSCLQSSSVPCPWGLEDTVTPISASDGDRFHPGPDRSSVLGGPGSGRGSVGTSATRASWLPAGSGTRAWLGGFALKYGRYCCVCLSPAVKVSVPLPSPPLL